MSNASYVTENNEKISLRPSRQAIKRAAVGLALVDRNAVLALDGRGGHHSAELLAAARSVIATRRSTVLGESDLQCDRVDCPVRGAVVAPLTGPDGARGMAHVEHMRYR